MSTTGVSRSLAGVSRSTAANLELQNRQRYLARRTMARRPSRIQPTVIIVMVLSLGLFFIGLIMTIIANWPGYSTVGSNPLEVAGPVLLVVGVLSFILGIFCVCRKNTTNKHNTLGGLSTISGPGLARTPSVDAKPGKGILKKTPSTSTADTGREFAEGDSGVAATTNASYERDSDSSLGSAGRFEGYRIESLPDPMGRGGARVGGPIEHSSDTEQPGIIPQPVRQISRPHMDKQTRSRAESAAMQAAANPAYSHPRGDWNESSGAQSQAQQPRAMKNYSSEGYDMYDPNGAQQQQQQRPAAGTQNRAYADDGQHGVPMRQKEHPEYANEPPQRQQQPQYAQPQRQEPQPQYAQPHRQEPQPQYAQPHRQEPQPQYQQQQSQYQQQQPLRINIKAQPGTSVHITPGAGAPQSGRPNSHETII